MPPTAAVLIETPGAGGYGNPRQRSEEKLQEDYRGGKFSAGYMKKHYAFVQKKLKQKT